MMAGIQSKLRRMVLPIFQRINPGDITIQHHWTRDKIRLHSFQHKGYWWHGRKREICSLSLCTKLIRPGDTVFDIGSHIGYLGIYFSFLVGEKGRVYCFEPSPVNLRYLESNVEHCLRRNIQIIRFAAGEYTGDVPFFVESLTGQNSTVVPDFKGLEGTSANIGLSVAYQKTIVPMIRVDSMPVQPDFVKIDVESGEVAVLKGMETILRTKRPRIMVETVVGSPATQLLADAGYSIQRRWECNVFAVPREDEEGLRICKEAEQTLVR